MSPDGASGSWVRRTKNNHSKEVVLDEHREVALKIVKKLIAAEEAFRPDDKPKFTPGHAKRMENKLRSVLGFNPAGTRNADVPVGCRVFTETIVNRFRNPANIPLAQDNEHPDRFFSQEDVKLWNEVRDVIEAKLKELGYTVDAAIEKHDAQPNRSNRSEGLGGGR